MSDLVIPVRDDFGKYSFQLALEGVTYNWAFRFNTRQDRWIMDLADINNDEIVSGVPMLFGMRLFDRFKDIRLPPGRFVVIDETGEGRNPGRVGFGDDFKLIYREAS